MNKKVLIGLVIVLTIAVILLTISLCVSRKPQPPVYPNTEFLDSIVKLQLEVDSLNNLISNKKDSIIYRDSIRTVVVTKYEKVYEEINTTHSEQVLDSIIRANF